ncbi:MAG: hypothetical protein EOL88_08910 [Bacteroidia bacterium]|nr:hypothetical protein [Bacteroidia bacterium]
MERGISPQITINNWRLIMSIEIEIIVTRHAALIKYLKEIGLATDNTIVVSHATPDVVRGKNVLGVLPHSLSCLTETFTEVPLNLPPEMRGKELTLEDMRKYSSDPVTYVVTRV